MAGSQPPRLLLVHGHVAAATRQLPVHEDVWQRNPRYGFIEIMPRTDMGIGDDQSVDPALGDQIREATHLECSGGLLGEKYHEASVARAAEGASNHLGK